MTTDPAVIVFWGFFVAALVIIVLGYVWPSEGTEDY